MRGQEARSGFRCSPGLPVNKKIIGVSTMSKKELKVPVEVYSRVVGYFRPVNQWNKGKQEEFLNRKEYKVNILDNTPVYEYQGNL